MGTMAVRSMAVMLGLLLFMAALVLFVSGGSVAQAVPENGLTTPTIPNPNPECEVGVVFYEPPDCDCPEGIDWTYTYEPGYEGNEEYIVSGVCGSSTSLTGDSVPSLTPDAVSSVSGSAYSVSLPSTGLPVAVLFAGGLAAAGAGLVFAGRRVRR